MSNVTFVFNKDLDDIRRARIISLKSQYWHYDFESQMRWMDDNLSDNDIHVFIENNGEIISYLNIIQLSVTIENDVFYTHGIGNVCTDIRYLKLGLATELIKNSNRYIENTSKSGLLLCHEPLKKFYEKSGWTDITDIPSSIFVAGKKYGLSIMSYNLLADICDRCVYIDKNF